jgi:hypothetical protein
VANALIFGSAFISKKYLWKDRLTRWPIIHGQTFSLTASTHEKALADAVMIEPRVFQQPPRPNKEFRV